MAGKAASREHVLIAIIAAAGDAGLGKAQLQKSAFLAGEEFEGKLPENYYQFEPYLYGPFAQEVYSDAERLCDGPLVEMIVGIDGRPIYRLSRDSDSWRSHLSSDLQSGVQNAVDWVSRMSSFEELLRAIYYLYPEQRSNSIFEYSEERAEEESLERSFRDLAAGRTRAADELIVNLQK